LLWMDGQWHRPIGSTPSTHIFKPAIGRIANGPDLTRSPEVEWLSLEVCRAFALNTAEARLESFEGIQTLVVTRFDRLWSEGQLLRIPIEDLCQALGVRGFRKYENEGGPGIREILELFDQSDLRDSDRRHFLKMQIVFWLMAATDGHAKNFSIFLNRDGFVSAPLYDVVSADPFVDVDYPEQKLRLAMCVGDRRHYRVSEIQRLHWLQTAALVHFVDVEDLLEEVVRQIPDVISEIPKRLLPGFPSDLVDPVLRGIERRGRILASP
jgi:serine/threonine-protein kinase HipA